jgi:hypothetical protein
MNLEGERISKRTLAVVIVASSSSSSFVFVVAVDDGDIFHKAVVQVDKKIIGPLLFR